MYVCVTMCDINCNYTIPTTVILESLSNQTCPGHTVTYTCVTDTEYLVWRETLPHKISTLPAHINATDYQWTYVGW